MNADEFRDNILGFIFYKYLSERLSLYADSILIQDDIKFAAVDDSTEDGRAILQAVSDAAIDELGYFLKPSELFRAVAQRGSKPGQFILEDLARIVGAYRSRTVTDRFSHRALLSGVAENDDNLNIPRYVDTFEAEAQGCGPVQG
jgi:type I restriction enzyme M protein